MEDKNVTYVKATTEYEAREKAMALKKNKRFLDRRIVVRTVYDPRIVGVKFCKAPVNGSRGDWRLSFSFEGEEVQKWSVVRDMAKRLIMGRAACTWEDRSGAAEDAAITYELRVKGRVVMSKEITPWVEVSNGEYSVTFLSEDHNVGKATLSDPSDAHPPNSLARLL